ncbi:MAG: mannosyl-3-phosphoglycerate synthase [Desulfurococcaceae archaeon]
MLISYPTRFETFGAVKFYEVSRVYSLFSIGAEGRPGAFTLANFRDFEEVASSTVFVVPVKDEEPILLEGVLRAIPSLSPIVVVSASSRYPLNMYRVELDIARSVYKTSERTIVVVHQKDKVLSEELAKHIPEITDEEGYVRYGKGEGLLIGTLIADALRASNVAFVDADNFIPSTVLEYSLIYYTTLGLSESKFKMTRIYWGYKAWSTEELYFRRLGRVSAIVNSVLNRVLSLRRRMETDIIKTANSGEHAMSIELAKIITYGGGYSVETQELVSILELCYIDMEEKCPALPENIEIFQVESRSPHVHSEKGEAHVAQMMIESLSTTYYSRLPDERGRAYIEQTIRDMGYETPPPRVPKYKYPDIDSKRFLDTILSESRNALALGI